MGTSKAELEKSSEAKVDQAKLEEAFNQLGSRSYSEREEAQKVLLAGGASTLEFLRNKKAIKRAEARLRTLDILEELKAAHRTDRAKMIRFARRSLLENLDADDTGGRFYEWFGTDTKNCNDGYRSLEFQAANRSTAVVSEGQLRLLGRRPGDLDQQMTLKTSAWPKSKRLPDRFSVTARIGGEEDARGIWHVGITVGRVKALFHPGYEGGGFRFEQTGTLDKYTGNRNMGFTPKGGELYPMTLVVEGGNKQTVKVTATIAPINHPAFTQSVQLDIGEFGNFDSISLARSGNPGGDAIFDDLLIELDP